MSANIARSISTCKAFGLYARLKDDGTAEVVKTDSVEFLTTNPEGKGVKDEGARALRENGIKVVAKDVRIEVVKTEVYAMTMNDFLKYAKVVDRAKGGYIRKSDLADDAEVEES